MSVLGRRLLYKGAERKCVQLRVLFSFCPFVLLMETPLPWHAIIYCSLSSVKMCISYKFLPQFQMLGTVLTYYIVAVQFTPNAATHQDQLYTCVCNTTCGWLKWIFGHIVNYDIYNYFICVPYKILIQNTVYRIWCSFQSIARSHAIKPWLRENQCQHKTAALFINHEFITTGPHSLTCYHIRNNL